MSAQEQNIIEDVITFESHFKFSIGKQMKNAGKLT